jgi:hypothetical protein
MAGVSANTAKLIERLFPPEQHAEVRDILAHDRIRFAVLKLSEGNLEKLRDIVDQAKIDWRDVLMSAGFGNSLTAHLDWAKPYL